MLIQLLLCAAALFAQSDTGDLRIKVVDQAGLPVPAKLRAMIFAPRGATLTVPA